MVKACRGMKHEGSPKMFERNKVDTVNLQQMTVAAEIEIGDGRTLKGKFIIPASRAFFEILNGSGLFLEFEPYGEARMFLAKGSIRSIKLVNAPEGPNLTAKARDIDTFDPHRVLGVEATAGWEEIRSAYHALAKTYHPDRFSGVELPEEVRQYLAAMARRINAAFEALEAPRQTMKMAMQKRAAPVYESRPRF